MPHQYFQLTFLEMLLHLYSLVFVEGCIARLVLSIFSKSGKVWVFSWMQERKKGKSFGLGLHPPSPPPHMHIQHFVGDYFSRSRPSGVTQNRAWVSVALAVSIYRHSPYRDHLPNLCNFRFFIQSIQN